MNISVKHAPYSSVKWGVFFILLAWLTLTLMATLSKFASQGSSLPMVVFFQNFISWLFVLPWVYRHGFSSLKTERFGLILLRSLAGFIGFFALFAALHFISLVQAMLLNNLAPILIPFVIWIWKRSPINHKLWPGILVGFWGVALILKPGSLHFNLGTLLGFITGVTGAISMVSMRILSYTEKTHSVLFYYFLIGSLFSFPLTLFFWHAPTAIVWVELIGIGVLSAFAQWFFMRAFHHAKASILGPFCYSTVAYSALIQWLVWAQIPDFLTWAGMGLICSGGIWTILYSTRK